MPKFKNIFNFQITKVHILSVLLILSFVLNLVLYVNFSDYMIHMNAPKWLKKATYSTSKPISKESVEIPLPGNSSKKYFVFYYKEKDLLTAGGNAIAIEEYGKDDKFKHYTIDTDISEGYVTKQSDDIYIIHDNSEQKIGTLVLINSDEILYLPQEEHGQFQKYYRISNVPMTFGTSYEK